MAIIIPSSKIYKKQNQKILDNEIERIEVSATKITPKNEYNAIVYGETFYNGFEKSNERKSIVGGTHTVGGSGGTNITIYSIAYYSITPTYIKNYEINIIKNKDNKYIDKLFYETDNAKIEVISDKTIGEVSGTAYLSGTTWGMKDETITNTSVTENVSDEIKPSWSYKYTTPDGRGGATASVTAENTSITMQDLTDKYKVTIKILCGYEEIAMGGYGVDNTNVKINGTYTEYVPKKVDINFNGNTLGIDLAEETILIGNETSKKVYSVDNNELLQTTNINTTNNKSTIINEYEQTLNEFIKGKETATVSCAISDYYDENGKLIINSSCRNEIYTEQTPIISYKNSILTSIIYARITTPVEYNLIINVSYLASKYQIIIPKGKTQGSTTAILLVSTPTIDSVYKVTTPLIEIGSEVVPYVLSQGGTDKPMSIKNGVAKVFIVVGNKIKYDGAIVQELTLQEK